MKRHAATILLTLLLLFPTTSFAQNSKNGASPVPDKSKVIATLLKEVDAGRDYIAKLERREAALVEEIAKAEQAQKTLTEAYKSALIELGELRATIQHQKNALAERKEQVERVTSERDEARKEAKSAKRENTLMKVGIAVLTIIKLIK